MKRKKWRQGKGRDRAKDSDAEMEDIRSFSLYEDLSDYEKELELEDVGFGKTGR